MYSASNAAARDCAACGLRWYHSRHKEYRQTPSAEYTAKKALPRFWAKKFEVYLFEDRFVNGNRVGPKNFEPQTLREVNKAAPGYRRTTNPRSADGDIGVANR